MCFSCLFWTHVHEANCSKNHQWVSGCAWVHIGLRFFNTLWLYLLNIHVFTFEESTFPAQMWSSLGRVGVLVVHYVLLMIHCQRSQKIREKSAKFSSLIWRAEKYRRLPQRREWRFPLSSEKSPASKFRKICSRAYWNPFTARSKTLRASLRIFPKNITTK